MPNVNFKFDADSSKVERAIKRLGTEFEKVVQTGDNIDKTLIDFGALVDKNADKVQNLKSEMQKLNAVNLQNMATQFERINAGGFNELIQGLRNVQTGVVGTENSIENLITKLGLSRNSLQQVSTSMRAALGNMGVGSAEYTATLSQLAILEQALGRIDQNVTASAANTIAANQNKITSTQQYMNSIRVANENFKNEILSNVSLGAGEVANLNKRIFDEAVSGARALFDQSDVLMNKHLKALHNYSLVVQDIILKLRDELHKSFKSDAVDVLNGEITKDEGIELQKRKVREVMSEMSSGKHDPDGKGFASQMALELDKLLQSFMETGEGYEKMIDRIRAMTAGGISVEQLGEKITQLKENIYNDRSGVDDLDLNAKKNKLFDRMTKVEGDLIDNGKLDKAVKDLADFSAGTKDQAAIVQNTLNILSGKTEEEVSAILMALQKLKQNSIIGGEQYKGLSTQIGVVNQEIQKTTRANQALAGGSTSATMAIQQMGFAFGDAGMVMQNWRGALMGIGNNIPFVIQNMIEMNAAAKAAGTTGLKAFGAALWGPAGILLGINIAIMALQILPDIFNKISASAGDTTKAIKSTKDILKELSAATRVSNLMGDESVKTTLAEGIAFKELTKRLAGTTAGSWRRKEVVDQIQASYPEYIKNIDLNKASEKDLTVWINKSTAALYGKIKAMLLDKLLEKNSSALVDASLAYQKEVEKVDAIRTDMRTRGEKDPQRIDKEGNFIGDSRTKWQKRVDDLNKAKKDLDKVTADFNQSLDRSMSIADAVMKGLGLNPDRANTDPDALKDYNKELAGDKGKKGDEYSALEKLADMWDKIIAKETDASKIAGLKYQKAIAIWDLSQKTLKTEEEKNKAEISYLNSVKEFAEYMEAVRKEKVDKLFDKASKAYEDEVKLQKMQDDTDEETLRNRIESEEKLRELKDRTKTEGMSESEKLTFDEQKELNEIMLDDYGDKEARMTQVKKYHAKLRAKLEQTSWENQMATISNFLASVGDMFKKNTLAYKAMAIASATIDTYKAANVALSSPLGAPWNFIEMATVIAAGLGNVASIIDTEITGYAKGGLINQPTLGLVGEAGAEIIAPVRDFQSYSRELIQSAYGGIGGGKELSVTVKGSDLVFTLQKATKKVNRQKIGGKV